jgi:hypothetical protein|tara:strand:- start:7269 stop:7532 length:264 start_codon:yes stop_codon:yes gene_type:complete
MASKKIDPKFVAERKEILAEQFKEAPSDNVKIATPEPTTEVAAESTTTEVVDGKTKKAGFMGLPTLAWVAIIGAGVYYAYTKGVFKK